MLMSSATSSVWLMLFAEVHAFGKQFGCDVADVVDFSNCHYSVTPQVRIDDYRLRVGVADDSESLIADEAVELVFKFRAEIIAFETVDCAVETGFGVKSYHSRTFGSEVRVVVCAVKQIVDTGFGRNRAEETSHGGLSLMIGALKNESAKVSKNLNVAQLGNVKIEMDLFEGIFAGNLGRQRIGVFVVIHFYSELFVTLQNETRTEGI